MRTCDGLGIGELWVSGYTPYPKIEDDDRLPHVSRRATKQIAKTALGAQGSVRVVHFNNIDELAKHAKTLNLELVAIEQTPSSINLNQFHPRTSVGLVFGNEIDGLDSSILKLCQQIVEVPMKGQKESFNVSVVAGIVLYTVAA